MVKKTIIESQDDLKIVLRRMTTRLLLELKNDTGESDFTGQQELFHFAASRIARESNAATKNVIEVILESDLEYVHKAGDVVVWLDDLPERLARAVA